MGSAGKRGATSYFDCVAILTKSNWFYLYGWHVINDIYESKLKFNTPTDIDY
jgi:hypothetical protein